MINGTGRFSALSPSERRRAMVSVNLSCREYPDDIEDAMRFCRQDLVLKFDCTSRMFPIIVQWCDIMIARVARDEVVDSVAGDV